MYVYLLFNIKFFYFDSGIGGEGDDGIGWHWTEDGWMGWDGIGPMMDGYDGVMRRIHGGLG